MTKLLWVTPNAEEIIGFCARVSNPDNQHNLQTLPRLIKYCIDNKHWSILEQANMAVEIKTTRAISAQILRHRSFNFQEFSQRYAKVTSFSEINPRRQDDKNRQHSVDDLTPETKEWFRIVQEEVEDTAKVYYNEALKKGIAKESARFLLPMNSNTTLYMNGTLRSWVHYIQVRTDSSTQKEHRDIALEIEKIFIEQFPIISEALAWR